MPIVYKYFILILPNKLARFLGSQGNHPKLLLYYRYLIVIMLKHCKKPWCIASHFQDQADFQKSELP